MLLAVGALVLGVAMPAMAQQPPFTVSFGGQMRVNGFLWNNARDFSDTEPDGAGGTQFKDNEAWAHERFRLYTTIQSADKKAKAVWALEVGDLAFGSGGGGSGAEYGGSTTRVGPSSGGGLGNDGANVETKNAYLWFEVPGVQGVDVILGMHNIVFLASPTGAFMDDDAMGIQINFKFDPIDLQLWTAKADENNRFDADDNDFYVARLGVNVTKDTRVTVEGMVVNSQCFARRAPVAPATTGTCVDADVGDTFWFGGTVGTKIATISLDTTFVYGQRALFSAANNTNIEEKGWGWQGTARMPVGPLSTWVHLWYTTGDENRIVGSQASKAVTAGSGQAFSTASNTTALNRDSDKLPVPIGGASWLSAPYVAEWMSGARTTGDVFTNNPLYNDPTGTWGAGVSGTFAVTPALSIGGGVAWVGATEDNGTFGDWIIEIDAGPTYRLNPQLSFQLVFAYLLPDEGDNAWAVLSRAFYAF